MGAKAIPIETVNNRLPAQSILTAIEYMPDSHVSASGTKRRLVKCICKCGNEHITVVADLIRGNCLSCGCKPRGRKPKTTIGNSNLFKRWIDMRARCHNPNNSNYKYYGAKGVIVCAEWLNNYEAFAVWSLNNGFKEELQLDKDIKGDGLLYSPDTCSWVSAIDNMSNTSKSVKHNFKGELLTIPQISRITGVLQSVLKSGIKRGKTIEEIISNKNDQRKFTFI